ncbi:hypothetical protein F5X99DRAFT_107200 [Biscogniauxia marginata]|nr:hypothetical protein F5X99DRAFT_107200 [Biscogniauxia marginata]
MATLPTIETQAKVASEAAQNFIDHYYESLNKRHPLAGYYSSASALLTAAGARPDLSINGQPLASAAEYEALLAAQGGPVSYEVGSWDAQPVNPDCRLGCPEHLLPPLPSANSSTGSGNGSNNEKAVRDGERVSLAVQVSGTVRYGRPGEDGAVARAFSEAWLLVPHWEAHGRNAPRSARRWLVVSQNFRAL